jgi:hypothetical protein
MGNFWVVPLLHLVSGMSWDVWFSRYSQQCSLLKTTKLFVWLTKYRKSTGRLNSYCMVMHYTRWILRRTINHAMPVLIDGAVIYVNTRSVTLVDVIQTLIYFDDWSSVSVRHNTYSTCKRKTPTDHKDTSYRRCHICSCGKTAVWLMRYGTRKGTILTTGVLLRQVAHYYARRARLFPDDCLVRIRFC